MLETQARMSEADDFFRCDKNGDGKLSEEEVMQVRNETQSHVVFCSFFFFMFTKSDFLKLVMEKVIVLSASANKLANLKEQAASYAGLIMEKLDPDHLGYIEVRILCS